MRNLSHILNIQLKYKESCIFWLKKGHFKFLLPISVKLCQFSNSSGKFQGTFENILISYNPPRSLTPHYPYRHPSTSPPKSHVKPPSGHLHDPKLLRKINKRLDNRLTFQSKAASPFFRSRLPRYCAIDWLSVWSVTPVHTFRTMGDAEFSLNDLVWWVFVVFRERAPMVENPPLGGCGGVLCTSVTLVHAQTGS